MNILFVGDIIGKPGRKFLQDHLAALQDELHVDFTVVNVENAAHGFGVTPSIAEDILSMGVDVLTSGNHIWDRREIFDYFPQQPRLLRPGNYPPGLPGGYYCIAESRAGVPVAVINLQGRIFMPVIDCPFQLIDRDLPLISKRTRVSLIDFHAEATSEKMAFSWYVDGRVSAVVGTHTHVPTADARILPKGTAYVSDVGMTGPYNSVIGMKTEASLARFLTAVTDRFEPATEGMRLCAVLIDVDEVTGRARSIRRVDRPT